MYPSRNQARSGRERKITMHKDLSDEWRLSVENEAKWLARDLHENRESLAIAREAMIDAFDKEAERLDNGDENEGINQ